MKPLKSFVPRLVHPSGILFLILLLVLPNCNLSTDKEIEIDPEIFKAYELRINGKTEEAKPVLESYLKGNPDDAMANLEMARLLNEFDVIENMESILYYTGKAILNDPDNPFLEFYNADKLFLKAYIGMMTGDTATNIRQYIGETCTAFQNVLKIDPGCREAYMYLVDIHGLLPEEMGGNRAEAEEYLSELEKIDPYYYARAKLILLQDSVEEIEYWKKYMEVNGESDKVIERLGRAYLMANDLDNAEDCFNKIILKNTSSCNLYLDLARGYLLRIMQAEERNESDIMEAKNYLEKYIGSDADKPNNTVAWTYGMLSRVERILGNQEKAEMDYQKATALNPNFSRAFAYPDVDDPPDDLSYGYSSYFRPF